MCPALAVAKKFLIRSKITRVQVSIPKDFFLFRQLLVVCGNYQRGNMTKIHHLAKYQQSFHKLFSSVPLDVVIVSH